MGSCHACSRRFGGNEPALHRRDLVVSIAVFSFLLRLSHAWSDTDQDLVDVDSLVRTLTSVPANHTLTFSSNDTHEPQSAPALLRPGVRQIFRATTPRTFQYELDPLEKGRAVELEVRQCYGRVALTVPFCDACTQHLISGTDFNLTLPMGKLHHSSGSFHAGSAIIKPITTPPVLYQMKVRTAGANDDDSLIIFPERPVITKHGMMGRKSFQFWAAEVNTTLVRELLPKGEEAALFYKLVAIPLNHSNLNANSTCGVMEAISRQEAVTVKLPQVQTMGKRKLTGQFPLISDGDYNVNVLVALVNQHGKEIANRCYDPVSFNLQFHHQLAHEVKLLGLLFLLGFVVLCWVLRRVGKSSARNVVLKEAVEMDDPYELQEEFNVDHSRLTASAAGRGKYVPPGLA